MLNHTQSARILMRLLKKFRGNQSHRARQGFTAIELVGVMAVLAILAAMLVPPMIKRIDQAAWTKERADLQTMASSFTQSILRNRTITNYAGMATAIAREMSLPVSAITTTTRGRARAFLVDQNLRIDGATLPYSQSSTGAASVVSARAIIVSSTGQALPVSSSDGLSDAEFEAIWDTSDGAKPTTATWNSWANGDDLLIQKLDLKPLFHQLILIDHDDANAALFSIDRTNIMTVPGGGAGWNKWYLDGTVAILRNPAGLIQTKYLMKRNIGFVFEAGAWGGLVLGGNTTDPLADFFAQKAYQFYTSALNPAPNNGGASQFSVLVLMYSFMFDFTLWANECPHFDPHGTSTSPEATLLKTVVGPTANGTLGAISGAGGLLK